MSEIPNLKFPNSALIPKILNHQAHSNLEIRKILTIFLSNCTNSSNCFNLNDDLTSQIFSVFLYILVDGIMDPNEQWLQDTSFDKMCMN